VPPDLPDIHLRELSTDSFIT